MTRTVIVAPASAAVRAYVAPVAPGIAAPDRSYWYVTDCGSGAHPAALAVNVAPTAAVPLMVGVGTMLKVPSAAAGAGSGATVVVV